MSGATKNDGRPHAAVGNRELRDVAAGHGVSYGDVFLKNEQELSKYNFEIADTAQLFKGFEHAEAECRRCIEADIPLAAYDQAIEASHLFNLLQARGVISVQERASYMGRVRDLAKGSCQAWMDKNGWSA